MKNLKSIVLLVGLSIATLHLMAQKPKGGQGGGERPAIGVLQGKVLDEKNKLPIEFATITLYALRDSSLITGGITTESGEFIISEIPIGKYNVEVAFIGYETKMIERITLSPRASVQVDLGTIYLNSSSENLEEAEVVANKDLMRLEIDKRVFDVSQNITATGGSANEVLENIPSVEVDIDGNVSLRGSQNVTVLIDGKPSGLTGASRQAILDQLPASTIESVEVITNPSAKYDPDGMSGIINIILKKNKLFGYSGNVSLSIGSGDNYNGSFSISRRNDKYNVFANYNYRYSDQFSERQTDRTTLNDGFNSILDQTTDGGRIRESHTIGLGTELYLTQKSTVYLNGTYQLSNAESMEIADFITFDNSNGEVFNDVNYLRDNSAFGDGNSIDLKFGYDLKFVPRKKELTIDFGYSVSENYDDGLFLEVGNPINLFDYREQNITENDFNFYSGQLDYVNRIGDNWKLETGLKSTLRQVATDFKAFTNTEEENELNEDLLRSNEFEYDEQINAVYGIVGRSFKKIGVQLGMRAEQANTESYLVTTDTLFTNDYFSLFPSGHLKYSVKENQEVMLSYSRRVNRPRTRQLNPFTQYSNPLLLRFGNPNLQPEYIDALEASYSWNTKAFQFVGSLYYKKVNDVIRRFISVEDDITSVTFTNLDNSVNEGIEAILTWKKWKMWNIMLSANVYRTRSDGSNIESDLNAEGYSGNGNANITWKNKGWQVQGSARYRAPFVILQGEIQSILFSDLAVKKSILKDKGSVGLRFSDLFNTREFNFDTFGNNFEQIGRRKRESQNVYFTFTYNFGKFDDKRRRQRGGGGDRGGDMDL